MGQTQRIRTEIGKDQKITVELQQEFGLLEVLSLKLTQQDIYTSLCADYGVVCGRISVNHGFGVPNARVSIFVPLKPEDEDDPVISALYPYKSFSDKTEDGYRYNLLPARQQHSGHVAVGTFPDQMDVLTREEILEVYESYFKYTVKTNDAGDFMIWGVPLGEQVIHVDLDVSDMGCFSLRPDDFLRKGYGIEDFKSEYEFKSSNDLDSLPQIITFDKGIEVYPFWGNVDLCEIGITRVDFDLSEKGLKIEPSALIIGGTFTDDGKNAVNKNCMPNRNMSRKCSFIAQQGNIDAIRFSSFHDSQNLPVLENYTVTDKINDDGAFAFRVPMNRDFIYTNEFGENDYTNDPNKGIPTSSCYRFRFTLADEGLERVRARGSYLAPNIREYLGEEDKSYAWSLQYSGYPAAAQTLILNNINGDYYPQDYFYRFQYGKVYAVSSFQSLLYDTPKRMLAINDIAPSEDKDCSGTVVPFPTNMGIRNTSFNFQLLLSLVLAFLEYVFSTISLMAYTFLGTFLKDLSKLLYSIGLDFDVIVSIHWHPFEKTAERIMMSAYEIQAAGQLTLPLTIYDTCDLCTENDEQLNVVNVNDGCKIAEFDVYVYGVTGVTTPFDPDPNRTFIVLKELYEDTTVGSSFYTSGAQRECIEFPECCGSYKISTGITAGQYDYGFMNSETVSIDGGVTVDPRFRMFIGGNIGAPISAAVLNLSGTTLNYTRYPITGFTLSGVSYNGFILTDTDVNNLFSIQNSATQFMANPIISGYTGYMIDGKVTKGQSRTYTGVTLEEGCGMYDTLYDESTTVSYLWLSGDTKYGDPSIPQTSQYLYQGVVPGIIEQDKNIPTPPPGTTEYTIGASVWNCAGERLPFVHHFPKIDKRIIFNRKTKSGYSEFRDGVFIVVPSIDGACAKNNDALQEWYRRKVIGLQFCGGVVNYALVDNWLSGALYFFQVKAKIKDKGNHQKVKTCNTVVRYSVDQQRFFYRSCAYNSTTNTWGSNNNKGNTLYIGHPTTFVDLGPRDEFIKEICVDPSLDPNCSVSRSIGPTSFKSFGELVAFSINYRMDVAQAKMVINDFFKNGGFYGGSSSRILNGDISQLISINSEAGIDGFDMQNQKYLGYSISILDPENTPDVFKNGHTEWGPTPITLQYEKDGVRIRQCLNAPGFLTEASQKVPFYLWNKGAVGFGPYSANGRDDQCWDYSGVHLDYLQGMTYGYRFNDFPPGGSTDIDDPYLLPPISYDFSGNYVTGVTFTAEEFDEVIDTNDPVLFPAGTFTPPYSFAQDYSKVLHLYDSQYHQFKILLMTAGTLMDPQAGRLYIRLGNGNQGYSWLNGRWSGKDQPNGYIDWDEDQAYTIWPTLDPYSTTLQILSTPFLFYFGLRPGKTGLDLLIQRFGPKGAFKLIE